MPLSLSLSAWPHSYLTAPPIAKPNQKSIGKVVQEKESIGLSIPEHRATQWQIPATSQNGSGWMEIWEGQV